MEVANVTGVKQRPTSAWPGYDAAVTGLRNYWYPVTWSRSVKNKPVVVKVMDEPILLLRGKRRVHALFDQCPHRGIPLSVGRREFRGTWTCRYHGWTFDLETGVLKAALTDGPDSSICGKVRVKTYPVEERAGLIWVYMGENDPPPVEADIPEELLYPDAVILGRATIQKGNWRYACENAIDEAHAKYLHRYGTVRTLFREVPAWTIVKYAVDDHGWLNRERQDICYGDEYGSLGHWPPKHFWKRWRRGNRISMHLPCILRNQVTGTTRANFAWYVPVAGDRYRCFQFYVTRARGLGALMARIYFWAYFRWLHLVQFNGQDFWMLGLMPETPPETLFRPDVSITAWRKFCEHARGQSPDAVSLGGELSRVSENKLDIES